MPGGDCLPSGVDLEGEDGGAGAADAEESVWAVSAEGGG